MLADKCIAWQHATMHKLDAAGQEARSAAGLKLTEHLSNSSQACLLWLLAGRDHAAAMQLTNSCICHKISFVSCWTSRADYRIHTKPPSEVCLLWPPAEQDHAAAQGHPSLPATSAPCAAAARALGFILNPDHCIQRVEACLLWLPAAQGHVAAQGHPSLPATSALCAAASRT